MNPRFLARVATVLLPKDYLRLWLTGEYVSEMSDASGTSWLDTWCPQMVRISAGRLRALQRTDASACRRETAVSGILKPALAARWGLPKGSVVAGGAGDNAASAIGLGAIAEGDGFVSLGTSGVLFAATESYRPNPDTAIHSFCHALPRKMAPNGP